MKKTITEPPKILPVLEHCDVLIAGGGIAGVSAALAAARLGAKVILAEREYGLGGMATLGLIAVYLPLCDGMGNQVIGGIGEELLHLSIRHGAEDGYPYPKAWFEGGTLEERKKQRFMVQFNPIFFALELEQLLLREGVRILYGTLIADVVKKGDRIDGVIVENKSGRSVICAKSFVDCTGDADLCRAAQVPTALFSAGNGLASWYYFYDNSKKVKLSMFGLADTRPDRAEGSHRNTNAHEDTISSFRFSGVDGSQLSDAVQQAHALMLEDIEKHRNRDDSYIPVAASSVPLVRMSRRLCGAATLTEKDVHKPARDSIGMTGDWTKRGPVYEIPFECLRAPGISNLLAAGRIISADDVVWNVTRVIPPCAVTGQAAGTAAALSSDFENLQIEKLQKELSKQGVLLHENEGEMFYVSE